MWFLRKVYCIQITWLRNNDFLVPLVRFLLRNVSAVFIEKELNKTTAGRRRKYNTIAK